ncbi:MAG: hypothetical protein WBM17_04005 [Anaerolineales bacterium]
MTDPTDKKNRGTRNSFLDSFSRSFSRIGAWWTVARQSILGMYSRIGGGRTLAPYLAVTALAVILVWLGTTGRLPFAGAPVRAGPTLTITKPPVVTSDSCLTAMIRGDVEKVHAIMLEFYDASALAAQTPADQMLQIIPNLQEIRRRAEALKVSSCLNTLRSFQISHMNIVINTLLAFMSKSDQSVLFEGIVQARLLNEEYKKEKARLLGETYIPPATRTMTPTAGTTTPAISTTP